MNQLPDTEQQGEIRMVISTPLESRILTEREASRQLLQIAEGRAGLAMLLRAKLLDGFKLKADGFTLSYVAGGGLCENT